MALVGTLGLDHINMRQGTMPMFAGCQVITQTNAELLPVEPPVVNLSEILSPNYKMSRENYILFFLISICMMTSSNGNISRVTGPLCGEFTGHRWIPLTKANDAELWSFLSSVPEQTVEQTIETAVIWEATALIMTSL